MNYEEWVTKCAKMELYYLSKLTFLLNWERYSWLVYRKLWNDYCLIFLYYAMPCFYVFVCRGFVFITHVKSFLSFQFSWIAYKNRTLTTTILYVCWYWHEHGEGEFCVCSTISVSIWQLWNIILMKDQTSSHFWFSIWCHQISIQFLRGCDTM